MAGLHSYIGPAAAGALTPIITGWLRRNFPPAPLRPKVDVAALRRRNGWIDNVATILCFVGIGMMFPVIHYMNELGRLFSFDVALASLGLAFSMAVFLPSFWICLVTLPSGKDRLREFIAFYQYRWEIGPLGFAITVSPFVAIGIVSFAVIVWGALIQRVPS